MDRFTEVERMISYRQYRILKAIDAVCENAQDKGVSDDSSAETAAIRHELKGRYAEDEIIREIHILTDLGYVTGNETPDDKITYIRITAGGKDRSVNYWKDFWMAALKEILLFRQ